MSDVWTRFVLTRQELDIVSALIAAYPDKEISRLKISEETVKESIGSLFDKLGVSSRMEVVLFAANHRLELRAAFMEAFGKFRP